MGDETRREHRIELFATILLASAAVATAWSTYQSNRWRGEQTSSSSAAIRAQVLSSEAFTRSGALTQVDIATFIQWVNADVRGERQLARFYHLRFRKEFRPAFNAWLATHPRTNPKAPLTPFAMPQYRVAEQIQSERLNAVAVAKHAQSQTDHKRADNYVLAVVLFAISLFFAGISTKLRSLRQREVLLALGWAIFVVTLVWIATSPISFSI